MSKLFSREKINPSRQIEWDFAKIFAIFLMILVHYFAFCTFGNMDYGLATEYMFILMQCSAPIFMFAMGVGMVYTRHGSPKEFVIRGIKLLLLGLIVNTMYFLSNYSAGVPLEYSLLSFLANDILQFAGLTFIFMGILKKLNISNIRIALISMLFSLIATYFSNPTFSNIYLNQFLGNFIETVGQNTVSCFPLLNWFIIPAFGMLFGENLIRCKDKDQLYKRILESTTVMSIIFLIMGLITRESMFSTVGGTVPEKLGYLHASIQDMIILIVAVLFVVSVLYFLSKRLSPKLIDFIVKTSKNVTAIYIIQWALILFLTYINLFLQVEAKLTTAILTLLFILIATFILTEAYVKVKNHF